MHQPDADTPGPSRARRLAVSVLKAVVSLGLLGVLLSRVDIARLWHTARNASVPWLVAALALYLGMILVSAWRWGLLLQAQRIAHSFRSLMSSFLVATFFNNFLPSNIGGDVVRVADTAPAAGSKTLATTVVLIDRGLGLLGLVLVAALGATVGLGAARGGPVTPALLWSGFGLASLVALPALLRPDMFARLLRPLRIIRPEWVDERIDRLTSALTRFREKPAALLTCFAGAVVVQAALVAFYLAIAVSLRIPITFAQLAVVVPISFIVQMLPVSMNGLGVREATFGFYFTRMGLPMESALLVSFLGAVLILLFSLSGGVVLLLRPGRALTAPTAA